MMDRGGWLYLGAGLSLFGTILVIAGLSALAVAVGALVLTTQVIAWRVRDRP